MCNVYDAILRKEVVCNTVYTLFNLEAEHVGRKC